jgi:hypothetical protein
MEEKLKEELEVELRSGTTLYALSQSKLGQLIRQFASGAVYTNEAADRVGRSPRREVARSAGPHR